MVTDVNRNDTDNIILCQCRNVSVLTSILKGEFVVSVSTKLRLILHRELTVKI